MLDWQRCPGVEHAPPRPSGTRRSAAPAPAERRRVPRHDRRGRRGRRLRGGRPAAAGGAGGAAAPPPGAPPAPPPAPPPGRYRHLRRRRRPERHRHLRRRRRPGRPAPPPAPPPGAPPAPPPAPPPGAPPAAPPGAPPPGRHRHLRPGRHHRQVRPGRHRQLRRQLRPGRHHRRPRVVRPRRLPGGRTPARADCRWARARIAWATVGTAWARVGSGRWCGCASSRDGGATPSGGGGAGRRPAAAGRRERRRRRGDDERRRGGATPSGGGGATTPSGGAAATTSAYRATPTSGGGRSTGSRHGTLLFAIRRWQKTRSTHGRSHSLAAAVGRRHADHTASATPPANRDGHRRGVIGAHAGVGVASRPRGLAAQGGSEARGVIARGVQDLLRGGRRRARTQKLRTEGGRVEGHARRRRVEGGIAFQDEKKKIVVSYENNLGCRRWTDSPSLARPPWAARGASCRRCASRPPTPRRAAASAASRVPTWWRSRWASTC